MQTEIIEKIAKLLSGEATQTELNEMLGEMSLQRTNAILMNAVSAGCWLKKHLFPK